jgi:hypothetical protein
MIKTSICENCQRLLPFENLLHERPPESREYPIRLSCTFTGEEVGYEDHNGIKIYHLIFEICLEFKDKYY